MKILSNEDEARRYVEGIASRDAVERLETLIERLGLENERQNLVSRSSLEEVWRRHIADSVQLLNYAHRNWNVWLDLGSGAGFPGLVIACLMPSHKVFMVESRPRRIDWLERMCSALDLSEAEVLGSRLEAVGNFDADVISARAFAPLTRLIDLSSRFSTNETVWLLPKGRSGRQELENLDTASRKMFHVEQSATSSDSWILVGQGKIGGRS